MKKVKLAFWIVILVLFGLLIYQNQPYFLSKHSLSLNIYFSAGRTVPGRALRPVSETSCPAPRSAEPASVDALTDPSVTTTTVRIASASTPKRVPRSTARPCGVATQSPASSGAQRSWPASTAPAAWPSWRETLTKTAL